eukprot:UN05652
MTKLCPFTNFGTEGHLYSTTYFQMVSCFDTLLNC